MKAKKLKSPETVALCKHDACIEAAQVKGFCRLHFLKVLTGKAEGDFKAKGKLNLIVPKNDPK